MTRSAFAPARFGTPDPVIPPRAPLLFSAPTVRPDYAAVGATLTCDRGLWEGDATITYTFQWLRDGAPIGGATSATYVRQAVDVGKELSCRVTATNSSGSATFVAGVASRPVPFEPPSGGGEEVLQFGTYGPDAPTISGLTLAWDFDFGYEPLGPMRPEIASRAGSDTTAFMHPASANLEVVVDGSGRRVLRFVAANAPIALVRQGFSALNTNVFTLVLVARRSVAGVNHTIWDVSAGLDSGTGADTLNRYRLRWNSSNVVGWARADGLNISTATPAGAPSLTQPNIFVGRANLSGDNISRAMFNGGAKASSPARTVTESTWDFLTIGNQMIWSGTGNGFPTWNQPADADYYRILLYAGAATDTDMDALHTWAAGAYPP